MELTRLQEKVLIECIGKKYTRNELAKKLNKLTNEKGRGLRAPGDLKGDIKKLVNRTYLIETNETDLNKKTRESYLLTNPNFFSLFASELEENYDTEVNELGTKYKTKYTRLTPKNILNKFFSLNEVGRLIKIYYVYYNDIIKIKKSLGETFLFVIEVFLVRNYIMIFNFHSEVIQLVEDKIKTSYKKLKIKDFREIEDKNLNQSFSEISEDSYIEYRFQNSLFSSYPLNFSIDELYDFERLEIRYSNLQEDYRAKYLKPLNDKLFKLQEKYSDAKDMSSKESIYKDIEKLSNSLEKKKMKCPSIIKLKELDELKDELSEISMKVSLFVYLLFRNSDKRDEEVKRLVQGLFSLSFFRTMSIDILDKENKKDLFEGVATK